MISGLFHMHTETIRQEFGEIRVNTIKYLLRTCFQKLVLSISIL